MITYKGYQIVFSWNEFDIVFQGRLVARAYSLDDAKDYVDYRLSDKKAE